MTPVIPTWAIVPAKSLARGKSRLRRVLDEDARPSSPARLLEHVLGVLGACDLDGRARGDRRRRRRRARRAAHGAHVLRDTGAGSLAYVVDGALADVASRGARVGGRAHGGPAAHRAARRRRAARARSTTATSPSCAITSATTRTRSPWRRRRRCATCFGRADSFDAHREAARAAGLRVASSTASASPSTSTARPTSRSSRLRGRPGDRKPEPEALVARELVVAAEGRLRVVYGVERARARRDRDRRRTCGRTP